MTALTDILGVQVITDAKGRGHRFVLGNMPESLRSLLPESAEPFAGSFTSPTPEGYYYIGQNHRFVEQLCQLVMSNTLTREEKRAAR